MIVIKYSRICLPFVVLSDDWAIEVLANKTAIVTSRKTINTFEVIKEGVYTNLSKAKEILKGKEYDTFFEIVKSNCMLPKYLVSNELVRDEHGRFYPIRCDSRMQEHVVGQKKQEIPKVESNSLLAWTKVMISSARPGFVSCKHKKGTTFLLDEDIWALADTRQEVGLATLICIRGECVGKSDNYLLDFVNELSPIKISISVVEEVVK